MRDDRSIALVIVGEDYGEGSNIMQKRTHPFAMAPRFGVDEAICTGDHACIRLSGCPSLSLKRLDDPLRDDPVASIDQSCVGCGNCGEVADAAILCPSFYRADEVHNPGRWERTLAKLRTRIIRWLQSRREARRPTWGAE